MSSNFQEVETFIQQNQIPYFATPAFQSLLRRERQKYSEETNEIKKVIIYGNLKHFATKVILINNTWENIPVDYFNNYYSLLSLEDIILDLRAEKKDKSGLADKKVAEWIRTYMKPRTFFHMLYMFARRAGENEFKNSNTPKFVETQYSKREDCIAVQNETCPEKLDGYAQTEDQGLCYYVAMNPNTSPETLSRIGLSNTFSSFVYKEVALNPNTPSDIQNYLFVRNGANSMNSVLSDTLGQLESLLKKNDNLLPQIVYEDGSVHKFRWRLQEFHDFVSFEFLKQDIENVDYTENSTSEPYTEGSWVISQPKDKLALAVWGKKVKNCVLSYGEAILRGSSEIFFVENNGVPAYTVEISGPKERGNSKQFQVKQIQKFGDSYGATRDTDQTVQKMIERAMA